MLRSIPECPAIFPGRITSVVLPVALFLAWAYELAPDGVRKTTDLPAAHADTVCLQALGSLSQAAFFQVHQ
jgi:hypothetical protein